MKTENLIEDKSLTEEEQERVNQISKEIKELQDRITDLYTEKKSIEKENKVAQYIKNNIDAVLNMTTVEFLKEIKDFDTNSESSDTIIWFLGVLLALNNPDNLKEEVLEVVERNL